MKKGQLKRRIRELKNQVDVLQNMNARLREMREQDKTECKHYAEAAAEKRQMLHETISFLAVNFHGEVTARENHYSRVALGDKLKRTQSTGR